MKFQKYSCRLERESIETVKLDVEAANTSIYDNNYSFRVNRPHIRGALARHLREPG